MYFCIVNGYCIRFAIFLIHAVVDNSERRGRPRALRSSEKETERERARGREGDSATSVERGGGYTDTYGIIRPLSLAFIVWFF